MKWLFRLFAAWLLGYVILHAQTTWPQVWTPWGGASWRLNLGKTAGAEMADPFWAHLHQGMPDGEAVSLGLSGNDIHSGIKPLTEMTDIQVRWLVKGSPVSPWLTTPFTFTLTVDNPGLPALDGVFDLSIDVQGAGKAAYTFTPLYLHLALGRALDPFVPLCGRDVQYDDFGEVQGPGCRYIQYSDMRRVGRPVDPTVTPWTTPTWTTDALYQEQLMPHTDQLRCGPMWWEEPFDGPHAGMKFVRCFVPKWDEDHRGLRTNWHHDRFPFVDGPRGIGWMSTYVYGQVDPAGNFIFAESGGPIRQLAPDGTITTLFGWVTAPGHEPVWPLKTLAQVRHSQRFVGTFASGAYTDGSGDGFRTPLDVAIDPLQPQTYYIAGYEDNVIWKLACSPAPCVASVLAGDPAHTFGLANGTGTAARFNGPSSLVFDPISDRLYVADQNNDAIRIVTRAGVVSTLFGSPGQDVRQVARGVTSQDRYTLQGLNRTAAGEHYVRGANSAVTLETYLPQMVRVDSIGNLILLDIGFGAIRRINTATLEATHLAAVSQRFERNDEGAPMQGITGSSRGFGFVDVDRWGVTGPKDTIYYGNFQGANCDGETEEHINEAFCAMPSTGAPSHFIFPKPWDPLPAGWGPRMGTSPPHYPWLMVVDPRGALLLGGGGELGITRLRAHKPTDFWFASTNALMDYGDASTAARFGYGGLDPVPMLRNGFQSHGYLGLPDGSDYVHASDAEISDVFGFGGFDASMRAKLIAAVKADAWPVAGDAPPPPPPPAPVDQQCAWVLGTFSEWAKLAGANMDGRSRTDTYQQTSPPLNGGALCQTPVGTTRVINETRPSAPPPPVDPCVASPLLIKSITFPASNKGSRGGSWNSGTSALTSAGFAWTPSGSVTFTAKDSRGCTFTRTK